MSKLNLKGLQLFKKKNDETYLKQNDTIELSDLKEVETVDDDDIIIKGQVETNELVRIKASDFFAKVEDEIGELNSALTNKADNSSLTNGSVTKVGTSTVGSGTKPIYLSSGNPTASSSTVGSSTKPVYINSGTITACSSKQILSIANYSVTCDSVSSGGSGVTGTATISRQSSSSTIYTALRYSGWLNVSGISISGTTLTVTFLNPGTTAHCPFRCCASACY